MRRLLLAIILVILWLPLFASAQGRFFLLPDASSDNRQQSVQQPTQVTKARQQVVERLFYVFRYLLGGPEKYGLSAKRTLDLPGQAAQEQEPVATLYTQPWRCPPCQRLEEKLNGQFGEKWRDHVKVVTGREEPIPSFVRGVPYIEDSNGNEVSQRELFRRIEAAINEPKAQPPPARSPARNPETKRSPPPADKPPGVIPLPKKIVDQWVEHFDYDIGLITDERVEVTEIKIFYDPKTGDYVVTQITVCEETVCRDIKLDNFRIPKRIWNSANLTEDYERFIKGRYGELKQKLEAQPASDPDRKSVV